MSKKYYHLKIPTKPFIKKWLETTFNYGISIGSRHPAILVVRMLLQGKTKALQQEVTYNVNKKHYTGNLTVLIPMQHVVNYKTGIVLTDNAIHNINYIFESFFTESLYMHIYDLYSSFTIAEAIEKFCDKYQIEIDTDTSVESLKKIAYRYKKNQEKYHTLFNVVLFDSK